ncbi:3-deoxy-manno-octulosonate cytidylyltransferase [Saccharibacter floricola]|uniref:3-deoxy-D-manno-octulosonate cytidylyltransferase n=1 Tax=Saccharibacter floricola DSM 15669 TaxID=1123227 RepID=A0ABQ0NZW1_9PROT|nr:3-deoxy-manno-octulosonate cytidylyltransferase [Saccharibacter floricola]GBQ07697.1 3-deoxy-D-manno-octulosonate cytidylyltransferase [Saccharibacter floricola DSM 15669]
MRPIIVIPSRLASTRLPRKALADIAGRPMIVRVVEQALKARLGPVVVAAGDKEIAEAVAPIEGVCVVLTDPDLPSGSDRVQAALEQVDPQGDYNVVINLQGDLPLIRRGDLSAVLRPLADSRVYDLATLVTLIDTERERSVESVVKAVCAFGDEQKSARALYFSRHAVPWGEGPLWHHVGIYAWRREALARFVSLPPSLLEQREKLEQLRALEAGMAIGCSRIAHAPLGVDTLEDLEQVRAIIA